MIAGHITYGTVSVVLGQCPTVITGCSADLTFALVEVMRAGKSADVTHSVGKCDMLAGDMTDSAATGDVCLVFTYKSTSLADTVCPHGMLTFARTVGTVFDSNVMTEVGKSSVFIDLNIAAFGDGYPISVKNTLVIRGESKIRKVEEISKERRVRNVVFNAVEDYANGVIYSSGGVAALGTGRTLEGVVAYKTAEVAFFECPLVKALFVTFGTEAVGPAFVTAVESTLCAEAITVPCVITGLAA